MKARIARPTAFSVLLTLVLLANVALAKELSPVALPAPQIHGGKPLMEALALRATSRAFAIEDLPLQTLSNLLWAAWGINRPGQGLRTAPSAMNWQETDVYVVMKTGAYTYNAAKNELDPVVTGDHRALTGTQAFVKDAPVTLVYVAEAGRMGVDVRDKATKATADELEAMKWADAAMISQNVSLFAASEGLATGVRALIDRPALAKALKLKESQSITLAQSIGFPRK